MSKEMNFLEMVNSILDKTEPETNYYTNPKLLKTKREENRWIHTLCLPGCKKEDVKANVEKPFIIVTVSNQEGETFTENGEYSLILPPRADIENINAFLEMGVLTLEIPILPKEIKELDII